MGNPPKAKRDTRGRRALLVYGGIILAAAVVIGVAEHNKQPETPPTPAEIAEKQRGDTDAGTAVLGEMTIRRMLKDPASGEFTGSFGRIKHGRHIACGYVNAKNSFGALSGSTSWVMVVEQNIAMIRSYVNASRFARVWNANCTGLEDGDKPGPSEFLGVAWRSRPPHVLKPLDATRSVWVFHDKPPETYLGVPITKAWYEAEEGRIVGGSATAKGLPAYEKLRAALTAKFGSPTSTSEDGQRLYRWEWQNPSGLVQLTFDSTHDQASVHLEGSS